MEPDYDVFISHAGEDKPFAIRIYDELKRRGISAFLDQMELQVAGYAPSDMEHAMNNARVGIFILSPEFAMKEWTMLELDCFLNRAGLLEVRKTSRRGMCPNLIPVFHRLTVAQCKYAGAFASAECDSGVSARFLKRANQGMTSMEKVLKSLALLANYTGVEGKQPLSDECIKVMAAEICNETTRVVLGCSRETQSIVKSSFVEDKQLWHTLKPPRNPNELVLNFSGAIGPDEAETCEAQVLCEVLREGEGIRTVCILGAAGVGKSCVLRALQHLERVKASFPGGVYFVPLGMDATLDTFRLELLKLLRAYGRRRLAERLRDEKNMEALLEHVGELFRWGRCLVCVDDVWERNGISGLCVSRLSEALSIEYGGVVVFTTQSEYVALHGDCAVHITFRDVASSQEILMRYSRFTEEEVQCKDVQRAIDELLKIAGGLPACLAVMGRGVRKQGLKLKYYRERAWKMFLQRIQSAVGTLLNDDVGEYRKLNVTLSAALAVLQEVDTENPDSNGREYSLGEMFQSLCVMKNQMVMPVHVLQRMWKFGSTSEVWGVVNEFRSMSLVDVVYEEDENRRGLRMHDLVLHFAAALAKQRRYPCEWHERLLDGYIPLSGQARTREWWGVKDDGYIFENVCRHLRASGSVEELVALLLRSEWTALRHKVGGIIEWRRDFSECFEGLGKGMSQSCTARENLKGLCLVRDAVAESWSWVSANTRELGYQLFGRLVDSEEEVVRIYLDSVANWHPRPWLRPLQRYLPKPGGKQRGEFSFEKGIRDVVTLEEYGLAAVASGKEVVIIDVERMEEKIRFQQHSGEVVRVWLNDDGLHGLSICENGTVWKWGLKRRTELKILDMGKLESKTSSCDENDRIVGAGFSEDGRFVAIAMDNTKLCIFDLEEGELQHRGYLKNIRAYGVELSRCGNVVIVHESSNMAGFCWDCGCEFSKWYPGDIGSELNFQHCLDAQCVARSRDGRTVVAGDWDGTVHVLDLSTTEVRSRRLCVEETQVYIKQIALSDDGSLVLSKSGNGMVYVSEVATGKRIVPSSQLGPFERIFGIMHLGATVPARYKEGLVVLSHSVNVLRIWGLETPAFDGEETSMDDRSFRRVTCLTASLDGRFFMSESGNGRLTFWDAETGRPIESVSVGEGIRVTCVAISPNSHCFLAGAGNTEFDNDVIVNGKLFIGTRGDQARVARTVTSDSAVEFVAFSPNGKFFVWGGEHGPVRVWHTGNYATICEVSVKELRANKKNVLLLPEGLWRLAISAAEYFGSFLREAGEGTVDRSNSARIGDSASAVSSDVEFNRVGNYHPFEKSLDDISVSVDSRQLVCRFRSGEICAWSIVSHKRAGSIQEPCHPQSFSSRLHIFPGNYVRSICPTEERVCPTLLRDSCASWFKLDGKEGLVSLTDGENNEVASYSLELERRNKSWNLLACDGYIIRIADGGSVVGTLPSSICTIFPTWEQNVASNVLAVGLVGEQLLMFRVENAEE